MKAVRVVIVANTASFVESTLSPLASALRERGAEVVLASPAGDGARRMQADGFRFEPIRLPRGAGRPDEEARAVLDLARLYRRVRPHVAHHYTIKPTLYGVFAARLTGVPIRLANVTGLGYVFTQQGRRAELLRRAVLGAYRAVVGDARCRMIFENPDDRELFVSRSVIDPERAHVIRSAGVVTRDFTPAAPPSGPPTVLMAGRLVWDKGVAEYVDAARRVRRRYPDARFLLAGSRDRDRPRHVSDAALRRWEREGVIEYVGHVDDMPSLLRRTHVVALPSYREGVPRILMEAACVGRPLVATDVPGCREVCVDGVTGRLVRPRDGEDLARGIMDVLGDPLAARRYGRNGRRLVRREFEKRKVIQETLVVYRELAAGVDGAWLEPPARPRKAA